MIRRSLKGKLLVFAVFFLGIVAGVLLSNVYETRVRGDVGEADRRVRAERDVRNFHDYLELTEEQREQVRVIMEQAGAEFRALAQQTRPQYQAIHEQTRSRIRALLNDEQRAKYDEFRQRRQRPGSN